MENPSPSIDQWADAYRLAADLHRLAPWRWFRETDMLAFRDPETDRFMAISLMGMRGEHLAVAVYPTVAGVYAILDLAQAEVLRACTVLETEQLQLSFEDRQSMRAEDRLTMKALDLRFRGPTHWPLFRAYRPSCFPWFVDRDELRVLCLAVEQVLAVAPRFRDRPAEARALGQAIADGGRFLTRVPVRRNGQSEWEERTETIPRPAPCIPVPVVDPALLRRVAKLPPVDNTVDVDLLLLPSACQDEPGQRPYFPCLPLVVESASGHILQAGILTPHPDLDAARGKVPNAVLGAFAQAGVLPAAVRVRTPVMQGVFADTCQALGIELRLEARLPRLEEAEEALQGFRA